MDHSTLITEFFERWDEYESNYGLLKNHKFDSKFNEIIPRGREFSDMVISEEKKKFWMITYFLYSEIINY